MSLNNTPNSPASSSEGVAGPFGAAVSSKTFQPYIASTQRLAELTPLPLLMGVVLGIIFGASSLYLALKVGMTVSASIPVAVLSITIFRAFSRVFGIRKATILENNITQTAGSAGESIAFGVAATMPALMILGFEMELTRVMVVSVLGGLLGILMMIPLRRALVDDSHGDLPFPEGTACAQVLIVGEEGGSTAKTVFIGFFVGLFYKFINAGMKIWQETAEFPMRVLKGANFGSEVSPELLGVGYIIGFKNSALMIGGGILSSWVLIPAIYLFGSTASAPLFPATKLISDMSPFEIWRNYVLYIGAGAVAAAGIFSLVQNLPTIFRAAKAGMKDLKASRGGKAVKSVTDRTQEDLPMKWVGLGCLGLVVAIWAIPSLHVNMIGAILIVLFGFLFVTVSSRLTGEIGSSSNPISGMTVATLLLTSLIFLALGWVSLKDRVAALSIAAIVCIASSNGGTTAQDLKTGHLIGGTPKYQQIAILFGALTSALVIGFILKLLNDGSTIYSAKNLPQVKIEKVAELSDTMKYKEVEYHILRVTQASAVGALEKVAPGKYLIDDQGSFKYLVDPGINGTLDKQDDGTPVAKFEAPKARLMALIIDGILTQKLPWGLILLGVFLVVMLELCGIPSLTFAVGVYLPLSSSMPIFIGGFVRWICDKIKKGDEGDSGPGVLLSSGLIAGGSIAGILLALLAWKPNFGAAVDFSASFPSFSASMVMPLIPFAMLSIFLAYQSLKGAKATKK